MADQESIQGNPLIPEGDESRGVISDLHVTALTPPQVQVSEFLLGIDPAAQQAYLGALYTLADDRNPDRIAQASNSLRNVTVLIARKIPDGTIRQQEGGAVANLIGKLAEWLKVSDPLGGAPTIFVQTTLRLWNELQKWFTSVSHVGPGQIEDLRERATALEGILLNLTKGQGEVLEEMDALAVKPQPSAADYARVRLLAIRSKAAHDYFFGRAGAQWFSILKEQADFLVAPPSEVVVEDGGRIFPLWAESQYLARIGSEVPPGELAGLIERCPKTNNPRTHEDFAAAAVVLPPGLSLPLVKRLKRESWLRHPFRIRLPETAARWAVRLVGVGENEAAFEILNELIVVDEQSGKRYGWSHDTWQTGQAIGSLDPVFVAKVPISYLHLLCSKLNAFIRHDKQSSGGDISEPEDFLHIRRPSVAVSRRDDPDDLGDLIIDSIVSLVGQIPDSLVPAVIQELQAFPYDIFRRLEIFTLTRRPGTSGDELRAYLQKPEIYFRPYISDELSVLLIKGFPLLEPAERARVLSLIEVGPENESPERAEHYRWEHLGVIFSQLTDPEKSNFESLAAKFNKKPFAHTPISSSATWIGPTSPYSLKQLQSMSNEDIVERLLAWEAPEDDFGVPSPEGLGRELQGVVAERAEAFSGSAGAFYDKRLYPVYIYHFFSGVQEALKKPGLNINWAALIALAKRVVDSDELGEFRKAPDHLEAGWESVLGEIAYFFRGVFGSRDYQNSIPIEYREDVWHIIEKLTNHTDPTPEHEQKYGGENMDPMSMAINSVRGKAMHAAVLYGLWCARALKPAKQERMPPELRRVLDDHLDPIRDPSLTIRSIYGQYLPNLHYLDDAWLAEALERIFPHDPAQEKHWLAAFEAYLTCPVFRELFGLLEREYEYGIAILERGDYEKERGSDMSERLPGHAAIGYVFGSENDAGGRLTKRILVSGSDELQEAFIDVLGRVILGNEWQKVPIEERPEKTKKLEAFWRDRLADSDPKVLVPFGWWFAYSPFSEELSLELLLATLKKTAGRTDSSHFVLEKLEKMAPQYPVRVVECLTEMAKSRERPWQVDSYKATLAVVLGVGNEVAEVRALELVDYFLRNGYLEFRELIPKK